MTKEQLFQLLETYGLGKYQDDILRFTRNTIFVKPQRVANEDEIMWIQCLEFEHLFYCGKNTNLSTRKKAQKKFNKTNNE